MKHIFHKIFHIRPNSDVMIQIHSQSVCIVISLSCIMTTITASFCFTSQLMPDDTRGFRPISWHIKQNITDLEHNAFKDSIAYKQIWQIFHNNCWSMNWFNWIQTVDKCIPFAFCEAELLSVHLPGHRCSRAAAVGLEERVPVAPTSLHAVL